MDKVGFETLVGEHAGQGVWYPAANLNLKTKDPVLADGACMALVLAFFSTKDAKALGSLIKPHLEAAPDTVSALTSQAINVMTQQNSLSYDGGGKGGLGVPTIARTGSSAGGARSSTKGSSTGCA